MNRRSIAVMAGALLIALVGCGGGSSNSSSGDNAAATVGAAGGRVATTSGNAVVNVPANALTSNTNITMQSGGQATANAQLVPNTTYTFGPSGTQFTTAASLTLKYDPTKIPTGATESSL